MRILEIACNHLKSCQAAYKGGANRIELFENLHEGGCTPSFGLIKKVKELVPLPIYVMIRPRGGDFHYSSDEIDIMKSDVNTCRVLAADGIVFGALTKDGEVDVNACKALLATWRHKAATFHRAFDRVVDIDRSIEQLIDLGFERVLTSGAKRTVAEGLDTIKRLQDSYGHRIKIMPGSGVTPDNARHILTETGVSEIHATCKVNYLNQELVYNSEFQDGYSESDFDLIHQLAQAIC